MQDHALPETHRKDRKLLDLGTKFDELTAIIETAEDVADEPFAERHDLFRQIAGTPAASQAGLKVKAHVLRYYEEMENEECELAMAHSRLRDLGWGSC